MKQVIDIAEGVEIVTQFCNISEYAGTCQSKVYKICKNLEGKGSKDFKWTSEAQFTPNDLKFYRWLAWV